MKTIITIILLTAAFAANAQETGIIGIINSAEVTHGLVYTWSNTESAAGPHTKFYPGLMWQLRKPVGSFDLIMRAIASNTVNAQIGAGIRQTCGNFNTGLNLCFDYQGNVAGIAPAAYLQWKFITLQAIYSYDRGNDMTYTRRIKQNQLMVALLINFDNSR